MHSASSGHRLQVGPVCRWKVKLVNYEVGYVRVYKVKAHSEHAALMQAVRRDCEKFPETPWTMGGVYEVRKSKFAYEV